MEDLYGFKIRNPMTIEEWLNSQPDGAVIQKVSGHDFLDGETTSIFGLYSKTTNEFYMYDESYIKDV